MEKNYSSTKRFEVNYDSLETNLTQRKSFKLADVKNRIEKVAFDFVRFTDSESIDDLWQIQSCEDGEYIVAMYDEPKIANASEETWRIIAQGSELQVFYKSSPITRFSLDQIGLGGENPSLLRRSLTKKLASDKNLVKKLMCDLSDERKNEIFTRFPELA